MKKFLSGDEAFAEGIRLAKPDVISAKSGATTKE